MTDEQRAELKRLAEKATNGPWEPTQCGGFGVIAGPTMENSKGYIKGGRGQICEMDDMDTSPAKQRANAKFIAAANPTAVLDLLKEHEENQGVIRVWRGRCERAEAERDALVTEVKRLMAVIAKADRDLECGATRGQVEADLCEALGEGA